ncbi:MAG: transposase [Myxococcales bacterium]
MEVTARTVASRFLLRPDRKTNELVLGVIGRAQHLYRVRIIAFTVMSNHLHALVEVDHAAQLAAFMQHALSNIAKEVGRHHSWLGPFWSRRYRAIVVADAASQSARLRYVLCQGLKEGLIDRVERWPGVSSFKALTTGQPLQGVWHDRSAEYEAKRRGIKPESVETKETYQIHLTVLPALAGVETEEYRRFVRDLVREEESSAAALRAEAGKRGVVGARRVLQENPHNTPLESNHSPAPFVHAACGMVRTAFKTAYAAFVDAFTLAASALRAGQTADFPEGSFPPSAPFVKPAPT